MVVKNNGFFTVSPQDVTMKASTVLKSLPIEDGLEYLNWLVEVLNCKHADVLLKIGEESGEVSEEQCTSCGWTIW